VLIDTHAHLDYPDFASDFDAMLDRALAAGVGRIITIGTSVESSRRALDLAARYPQIYAVVGVHPTSLDEVAPGAMDALRQLAGAGPRIEQIDGTDGSTNVFRILDEFGVGLKIAAIGETGLDYHRLPEGGEEVIARYKSTQALWFRAQLDLAAELGLNVVIHQRDAWEDTLAILSAYQGRLRGVFHCFGGTPEQAAEVIALGHFVSFTGIATFRNGAGVRTTAASIPDGSFMVETDCPYLAPVPFRGQRCEPAHTLQTAQAIAAARGVSLEIFAMQTTMTAEAFFRFRV
jgi:TatD DNase family protein